MAAPQITGITAKEYLARERAAVDVKSEFWDGKMVAMSGARVPHIRIGTNLVRRLANSLDGSGCEPYANDLRVAADPSGKYFYPDVAIACEDAEFLDDQLDTLLNPVVVIEVLSPSTEVVDRTVKLDAYREIASLRHYLLIDSRSMAVDHYRRESHAAWLLTALRSPGEKIDLAPVPASISLQEIYERVQFNLNP